MTVRLGFIILAHAHLHRTRELAQHLLGNGADVAIHIDARCPQAEVDFLRTSFRPEDPISITQKHRTSWGGFGLVQASLDAAKELLSRGADITHVTLLSGSCLPLRPIRQFQNFLSRNPYTDFIESVDVASHKWVQDGLSEERFDFFFPFSWKTQKFAFDWSTEFQRKLGVKRKPPLGLKPHLGSQWWCLSRQTLQKIISDPNRKSYDRFFRHSWIPDESYFQSLVRLHSERLTAQSMTWSKFDAEGKPFIVYNDLLQTLESSDCFFLRKAWHGDDILYATLLSSNRKNIPLSKSVRSKADEPFNSAIERTKPPLNSNINAGRYPKSGTVGRDLARYPYTVIFGPQFIFSNLDKWIGDHSDAQCHTDLFDRQKIKTALGQQVDHGNLPMNKLIRNNAPKNFLHNFIANASVKKQVLFFDSLDSRKSFEPVLRDGNARIYFLKNAWIAAFAELSGTGEDIYSKAANLQRAEEIISAQFDRFKCKAEVQSFDFTEMNNDPFQFLQALLDDLNGFAPKALAPPKMVSSKVIQKTLTRLKNDGFAIDIDPSSLGKKTKNVGSQARPKLVK